MTSISFIEGNFTEAAGRGDTAASLGIFQWALGKDTTTDPNSSLVVYFQTLKKRARDAGAKQPAARTDEENLFVQAWKQVSEKKVDVTAGGSITVDGTAVSGSKIQTMFANEFGIASLKKYQIVGVLDKIRSLVTSTIRPNPGHSNPFGSGYSQYSGNLEASFFKSKFSTGKSNKKFEIAVTPPAAWVRVGDILNDEESLSLATTIYANRTNAVTSALWYSIKGQNDIKPKVAALLETIAKTEHANRKNLMPIDHAVLDPVSKAAYDELQKLIWVQPSEATRKGMDIMQDVIRISLSFYDKKDLVDNRRWERIATSSAPFGSPSW